MADIGILDCQERISLVMKGGETVVKRLGRTP